MSLQPGSFGGRSQTQRSTVPFTSGSRRGRTVSRGGKLKQVFPWEGVRTLPGGGGQGQHLDRSGLTGVCVCRLIQSGIWAFQCVHIFLSKEETSCKRSLSHSRGGTGRGICGGARGSAAGVQSVTGTDARVEARGAGTGRTARARVVRRQGWNRGGMRTVSLPDSFSLSARLKTFMIPGWREAGCGPRAPRAVVGEIGSTSRPCGSTRLHLCARVPA